MAYHFAPDILSQTVLPRIGPEGAACLAGALMAPHGCPLRKLWIVNGDIGPAGFRAMAAALFCNDGLLELNLSENLMKKGEQLVLLQALGENTRLKSIICKKCGLSDSMEREIQTALVARNTGKEWKERRRVAGVAGALRQDVLTLMQKRLITYPRLPVKQLLAAPHRRVLDGGAFEPMWARHDDGHWSDGDIDTLLAGPIPLGEGFGSLGRLSSELHDAQAGLRRRIDDLTRRGAEVTAKLHDTQTELRVKNDAKRALAELCNESITASTFATRQAQLRRDLAAKHLQEGVRHREQYEMNLADARRLVEDCLGAVERVLSKDARPELCQNEITSLDASLASQVKAAQSRLRLCEEFHLHWSKNQVPKLEAGLAAATSEYEAARAALGVVFQDARDKTAEEQSTATKMEADVTAMQLELAWVQERVQPSQDLFARISAWLEKLDDYIETAHTAEEWRALVPVSCGDEVVDDALRRSMRHQEFRKSQLLAARNSVIALQAGKLDENAALAAEDVRGHELLMQLADQTLKRVTVDYQLALAYPMIEETFKMPKGGQAKPVDLIPIRAQKPLGESHAAFVVGFAAEAHALVVEAREKEATAKRRNLREDERRLPTVAPPALDHTQRGILGALKNVRVAGPGPQGDDARAEMRKLTLAVANPVRRYGAIRRAQLMDEAVSDLSAMSSLELQKELAESGSTMENESITPDEMRSRLVQIRVSRGLSHPTSGTLTPLLPLATPLFSNAPEVP